MERIAIIGSGIAGLTVGWQLSQRYQVTLFEKGPSLGMAQFGVKASEHSNNLVVDVPLRVFNRSYYPNLFLLCKSMGVPLRLVDHGGAFGRLSGDIYFRYENITLGKKNISYIRPTLRRLGWLASVGWEILKLKKDMPIFLARSDRDEISLGEFFQEFAYSHAFQYQFFLPILAAVCTCSYSALLNYPAGIIVEGMKTLMETTPTQRFVGGTQALQLALAQQIPNIRYNSQIRRVAKEEAGAAIIHDDGSKELYDHVIFATQANQALELLGSEFGEDRDLLQQVHYQKSDMLVHRDPALMPRGSSWPPVYYGINEEDWPMATIWINRVEPGFEQEPNLFQTWNPLIEPDPTKVLGRTTFERPVVTQDSLRAMETLSRTQGSDSTGRRVWFCGSYATRAIPLLESGLVSAISVAQSLGVAPPSWFQASKS